VVYLDERPAADEGPFLKEERSLINAIAAQLGAVIERKSSETELRRKIEDLERQNTELKDLMTTTLHPVHESGS